MFHKFKNDENKKKKYWLVDTSFHVYNSTFAQVRDCICQKRANSNKECSICGGKGKIPLQTSSGIVTGGLYGIFLQLITRIDEGYKIEMVFDPPKGQLDRSNLIDGYKANRGEKPEFITYQMEKALELFPMTSKIACYTSETDESDDVLACRAIELAEEGHDVVVSSDDKDMFPLLMYENIKLHKAKEIFGIPEFHRYMKKKWNVSIPGPERFSEFLAIIGDIADNYNLIVGLGPKAAEYFINKYDHISDLWDDWKNVPDKYKKKLVSNCNGNTCIKCKTCDSFADFAVPQSPTIQLVDQLNTSLKLAYLNTEAKYYKVENTNNYSGFYNELKELELYTAIKNIHKFF